MDEPENNTHGMLPKETAYSGDPLSSSFGYWRQFGEHPSISGHRMYERSVAAVDAVIVGKPKTRKYNKAEEITKDTDR